MEKNYLSRDSHVDYIASEFLKEECGIRGLKFSPRVVVMKNGTKVALLHVEGIAAKGQIIDADFWPSSCQTLSDLEKLPDRFEDVRIRFGFFTDEATGDVIASKHPNFLGYYLNGEFITFSGKKPVWNDDSQSTIWTNEESQPAVETNEETDEE